MRDIRSDGRTDAERSLLWWAGLFSFMSVQMQFLLRGILAWDLTLRERSVGTVYFFFGLSMLVTTLMGGVAADRLPKRMVLLASQSVLMLSAVGLGIAVVVGREQFWMLLVASVIPLFSINAASASWRVGTLRSAHGLVAV